MSSELSFSEVAVVMGLGVALSTGCGIGDQDDLGGADYGGPHSTGTEDWYEEESTPDSDSTSESSSTTETSSSTESSSGTEADTSTDTGTDTESGSETAGVGLCGWSESVSAYACGFEGSDPGGTPLACPEGLVAGEACGDAVSGVGCCDAEGNLWLCEGGLVSSQACMQ